LENKQLAMRRTPHTDCAVFTFEITAMVAKQENQ